MSNKTMVAFAAAHPTTPDFTCRLCGAGEFVKLFVYPDKTGRATRIFRCTTCECMIPDYPLDTEPDAMLRFQTQFEGVWPDLTSEEASALVEGVDGIVRYYKSAARLDPANGLVLEIGAGRGGLLQALRLHGFGAVGCEPTPHLVRLARKAYGFDEETLQLSDADPFLESFTLAGRPVQAVFAWHVLEHIYQPLPLLRRVARALQKGGVLIAQIPLLNSEQMMPAHLFFMTEATVGFAAEQCGLRVVDVNYDTQLKFMAFLLAKD
jgi:SAM-dependent methyltransferase